mmetsp:Transcript_3727/g.13951  ORF Transcript_3727/g.13951 Transcript_3727/m.13951 type:complete len:292 (-) Transcript_3727:892-1767(-)
MPSSSASSSCFTSLARIEGGIRIGADSMTQPPREAAYALVSASTPPWTVSRAFTTHVVASFLSPSALWPSRPFSRLPFALVAHSRRSGCECSSHFSSSGLRLGMKGFRSRTSSTSAQMFPHVTAAFCLSSLVRSRSPRRMMGRTTARLGASIELTKVVSMSLSRHFSVSFWGSLMASMTRWSIPSTSAFFTHRQMGSMTCPASADTFGWVSKTHSRNAGKISGMVRMKYCGTRCARSPQVPRAPHFACQLLCPIACTSAGDSSFIAVSGRLLTSAVCPASAAALTSADASP